MKRVIVIGSGAGGATVAKELTGHFDVTVLEAGGDFNPLRADLSRLERMRGTGLFRDERLIRYLFPAMKIRKTAEKTIMVNGMAAGGSTTISTGNALRMDGGLAALGIDLDTEFDELAREVPVSTSHRKNWRPAVRKLFEICADMGLDPRPTPKMGEPHLCIRCGRCVLGCPRGAKWDSRRFLNTALGRGARMITGARVEQLVLKNGAAVGVQVRQRWRKRFMPADLVIVAAGGFGTPVILRNSGIDCEAKLFVDPVLCVAAEWPDAMLHREIPMPFVVQRESFIVSPYFDHLSFFFNRDWRIPARHLLSLMIKLADENRGEVKGKKIHKTLSETDRRNLQKGIELCTGILRSFGIRRDKIFYGTLNAGHPGGMLPLTRESADTFHPPSLPQNVFVADATLFPSSLGNPPILTIMAMAKRVSRMSMKLLT